MDNLKTYFRKNSLKNITGREMKNPFKTYRPLDKGNIKLHKNILSFSLLPVVTCGMWCNGCYDTRALRYPSVREKRLYNTHMAINEPEKLKALIITQIKNSKSVEFIRIHVGGDFFDANYANLWAEIKFWAMDNKPDLKFYTYTKTHFEQFLQDSGINVVKSILPNGNYNFDTLENLQKFKKSTKEKYIICPATLKKLGVTCGKSCTACMDKQNVLFVKH